MKWKDNMSGRGGEDEKNDRKDKHKFVLKDTKDEDRFAQKEKDPIDVEELMYRIPSKEEANRALESILDTMLKIIKDNMKEQPELIYKYLKTWELTVAQINSVLNQYETLGRIIDLTEAQYPEGIADISEEMVLIFFELLVGREEAKDPLWVLLSMLKTIKRLLLWSFNANQVFAKIPSMLFKKLLTKSEVTDKDVEDIKRKLLKQYKEE